MIRIGIPRFLQTSLLLRRHNASARKFLLKIPYLHTGRSLTASSQRSHVGSSCERILAAEVVRMAAVALSGCALQEDRRRRGPVGRGTSAQCRMPCDRLARLVSCCFLQNSLSQLTTTSYHAPDPYDRLARRQSCGHLQKGLQGNSSMSPLPSSRMESAY